MPERILASSAVPASMTTSVALFASLLAKATDRNHEDTPRNHEDTPRGTVGAVMSPSDVAAHMVASRDIGELLGKSLVSLCALAYESRCVSS